MRNIDMDIEVVKQVTETIAVRYEEIESFSEIKSLKEVQVKLNYYNRDRQFMLSESYKIDGENYDLLMSTSDVFGEGKSQDEFRKDDLFYVIDTIRGKVV